MEDQHDSVRIEAPSTGNIGTDEASGESDFAGKDNDVSATGVAGQPAGSGETQDTDTAGSQQGSGTAGAAEQQQSPAAQPEQPGQSGQNYQLPPGYAVDPATGQVVFVGIPAVGQPVQPGYVQPQPQVVYMQPPQPTPEQVAAQQAAAQQRYGQVVNTVEKFIEGEATVSDVVKTLYTNTTQDDQLWKGVIVGAAAAFLLTSEPVRKTMGETMGSVFPGLKKKQPAMPSAETKTKTSTKPEPEKE